MKKLIHPYYRKFVGTFKREKDRISKKIKAVEIHHIGSTSVPGLGGKGMIDIMIGIKNWKKLKSIVKKLKAIGFNHIHPKEGDHVFLSKVGPTGLNDTHLHIVVRNGKSYKEFLTFRDYLRKNKQEVKRFFKLKKAWAAKVKGDRLKYGKLKRKYVEEILKRTKV